MEKNATYWRKTPPILFLYYVYIYVLCSVIRIYSHLYGVFVVFYSEYLQLDQYNPFKIVLGPLSHSYYWLYCLSLCEFILSLNHLYRPNLSSFTASILNSIFAKNIGGEKRHHFRFFVYFSSEFVSRVPTRRYLGYFQENRLFFGDPKRSFLQ